MKKVMLFFITLLFTATVNAASINLAKVGVTAGTILLNNTASVLATGALVDTNKYDRPYAAFFDLNVDADTGVDLGLQLLPLTDVSFDLFRLRDGGGAAGIVEDFAILSGIVGNESMGSFLALASESYRIVIRSAAQKTYNLTASVSEVPVPAALFLFAPALLGFLGLRRKASLAA
jgi:hypothetical protein